jgi:hypothetical protein
MTDYNVENRAWTVGAYVFVGFVAVSAVIMLFVILGLMYMKMVTLVDIATESRDVTKETVQHVKDDLTSIIDKLTSKP